MRKFCLVALLTLLFFASCNNKDKVRKPDVFLSEQQMVDVLTDAYLLEAELTQKKSSVLEVSSLQKTYYDQLFEHYAITDTIFDQNMYYYSHHPDILERVMDSVMNRFVKAQQ